MINVLSEMRIAYQCCEHERTLVSKFFIKGKKLKVQIRANLGQLGTFVHRYELRTYIYIHTHTYLLRAIAGGITDKTAVAAGQAIQKCISS